VSRLEKTAAEPGRLRAALALVLRRYARQLRARPWLSAAGLLLPGLGNIFIFYVPPIAIAHLLGVLAREQHPSAAELVPSVALLVLGWLGGEAIWRLATFAVQRLECDGMSGALCRSHG
jgi:ATP-binding cassette, subfamily B, bacterial